jgi:hypothetical protein
MNKTFYALCLCLSGFTVSAQNPGGVSANLKLWLKSDAGTTTTGSLVDGWTYVNDNTKSFTGTGTERPTLTTNVINFRPGVVFGGSQMMDGPVGALAPITALDDDYSVIAVWSSSNKVAGSFQRVWSQRSTGASNDGVSLWVYNDNNIYGDQAEIGPTFVHLLPRPFAVNTWYISQLNLLAQATQDLEVIDNVNISTGIDVLDTDPSHIDGAALRQLSDAVNKLGARSNATDEPFYGSLVELIVFDRPISGAERARIFSYLALKYGITIKTNLVASDGSTIWDATANATYNNDVTSLGRDNGSGLLVNQSNAIATGNGDGTGKSGQGNVTLSNPSAIGTDLSFLTIGHDNGGFAESNTDVPAGATTSNRIAREWKVSVAGSGVGTVNVTFDMTGLTLLGTQAHQFRLMVGDDADFTAGTVNYYSPSSFTLGGKIVFSNVPLANNDVFTIITAASAALPVTWKSFTGQYKNDNVYLNWAVENNENGDRYEVEHSTDGVHYSVIGTVDNKTAVKNYNYTATTYSNGVNYYRIHQIDNDGKDIYSTIVSVNIKGSADFAFKVLDNPVKNNNLKLEVRSATSVKASIELWSLNGVRVLNRQQVINGGKANVTIPINNIAAGSYVLKVKTNGTVRTAGIVKF